MQERPTPIPEHLLTRILERIHREERVRALRRRIVGTVVVTTASAGALVPFARAAWNGAETSGFTAYVSIVLAYPRILTEHGQDVLFAVAETLPTIPFVFALIVLGAMIVATRVLLRHIRIITIPVP